METTSLKDLLREHLELKGLTPKKIADMTSIPERYIMTLLEGTDEYLPPAPYVHGYITKLSGILNFDKETVWRLYQKESLLRRAGNEDRLPGNRFAVKPFNRAWLFGTVIIGAGAAYLIFNLYSIVTPPTLRITVPADENSATAQQTIILQGVTNPAYTLAVNGSEVYIEKNGSFQKEFPLQEGLNTVIFVAKKFLGKETRVMRSIMYTPPPLSAPPIDIKIKTNMQKITPHEQSTSTNPQ